MTDTNQRSDNESWLFDLLTDLEEQNLLADFCRHIGIAIPIRSIVIAEGVWPLVRDHYQLPNANFDVTQASRDMLRFQPLNQSIGEMFKKRRGPKK
ncbi:MAG: hypothetical protein HOG95_05915 [Rhodospirillaceae bacterium]|jgi:hypothetical protein|nr:hypothetical protein [Rhodospirillaceae bacterium]MBT5939446.1 hypothetical protein [Rhodospirillaceae bacterium]MBT7268907.1 hypothetical protein [Rhodospirillaceae bacterium]